MEVLARASLSRYHPRGVSHQIRGQTCFEAYRILGGRTAQITQRLVRLDVADQHFTKSVHRPVRAYMLSPSRCAAGDSTLLHQFIPTIIRTTHYGCREAPGRSASLPPLRSSI